MDHCGRAEFILKEDGKFVDPPCFQGSVRPRSKAIVSCQSPAPADMVDGRRSPEGGGLSMRSLLAVGCLAVVFVGCGGGDLSMADYAESVEALAFEMSAQLEESDAQVVAAPTIETLREVLPRALDVRAEFQEGVTALVPPDELADLHTDLVGLHARIIVAQGALAARAETATGFEELDESAEALAYRATQTESESLCQDLQERIDATADRAVFVDVPWIPGDMKEVVKVTFGC
jgi:hypothetical protein